METVCTSFEYRGEGKSVFIAGSWNSWQKVHMQKAQHNLWCVQQAVPPGVVQFKFIVDDTWKAASNYDLTDDGHGAHNNMRVINVPENDTDKSQLHDLPELQHEHVDDADNKNEHEEPTKIDTVCQPVETTKEETANIEEDNLCDSDTLNEEKEQSSDLGCIVS